MFYLYSTTEGEFTQFVFSLNAQTLFVLIGAYSVILVTDVFRLSIVLHPTKKSISASSLRGSIIAPSLNMIFPGRAGDLNALVSSSSSDWPISQRARNLVLLRLTDLIVLSLIGAVLAASFINIRLTIGFIIIALLSCIGVYMFLPYIIEKFASVLKLPIGDFKPDEDQIALSRFTFSGFSSFVFWIIQGLFTYLIVNSFGVESIAIFSVIAAVAAANLSKIIPITPGGVGIYENALALALLHIGGLSTEIAASIALADGVFRYVLTASMPWLGLAFNTGSYSQEEE